MTRRIIDIIKPGEIKKKEKISTLKKEEEIKLERPSFRIFLIPIILVIIIGVGLGIFSYYFSLGVKIIIQPKQDILSSQMQVTVDKGANDINIFAKIIPGHLFQEEKTISQEFPITGKVLKETKAEGIIRVYNKYSTSSQILVAATRFISSDGKLFKSLERVVIPGGKYEKGKLQPGYLDIKVKADQPGEDYNIEPSTFSIPGFAGTPKYTGFYGKSFEPMKGGFRGEVAELTEKDIENAKNSLSQRLFKETRNNLKSKIFPDFVLIEEAIKDRILETSLPQTSVSQETVKVEIRGISEVLVFKKTDLENFAKETLLFQNPADKKLHQESLKIDYSLVKSEIDLGKLTLELQTSVKIFSEIDEAQIKENIVGKTPSQIREFLSIQPQIEKTEIKLLPFWSKEAPKNIEKIKVETRLD